MTIFRLYTFHVRLFSKCILIHVKFAYETKGSNRAARVRTEEERLFLKYICLSQYVC